MLTVVDIEYIRKKYYVEGWSIRKIARQCEVSRQSVRKALKDSGPWRYRLKEPKPCPVMDKYREVVISWLKADEEAPRKQRHTAKRVYDRLCEEFGFKGADSTVRRYVARLRRELGTVELEPVLMLTADPGEVAQADWGKAKVILNGVQVEVHLFCMRLRSSGVPFVWVTMHERMEAFLEGHVRAFEWFGGVVEKVVYDNLPTAVKKVLSGHQRELTERFVSLRAHYLFESVFCNTESPHEKGSVENLVGYVRRNALTPQPEVTSMNHLNEILLAWCEKERSRLAEAWEAERRELRAVPAGVFRPCVSDVVRVNKLSLVTCQRNRYSVPNGLIGSTIRVDLYNDRVEVWHREKLVAEHTRLLGRNNSSLKIEHYLKAISRKPYAVTQAAVVRRLPSLYQQARELASKADPSGYREFVEILMLHRDFEQEDILEVLGRAVRRGRVVADEIRQELLNRTAPKPDPVAAGVPQHLLTLRVEVGNPRDYDRLLGVGA